VHPEHRRQDHGRHLLTSLASKLAILGPPRIVAEVPETLDAACRLFSASGYVEEASLVDYVFEGLQPSDAGGPRSDGGGSPGHGSDPLSQRAVPASFVIPVTVDDLVANGVLGDGDRQVCWARSVETLTARKDHIAGLAVASEERIEAYVLHEAPVAQSKAGDAAIASADETEIVALRSLVDDDGDSLRQVLAALTRRIPGIILRFTKVHPEEFPRGLLETCGFRAMGRHLLFAATARPN
jgi:hypothetical protein